MKSHEFNSLTKEQAEEGFFLCGDNADIHYDMAVLIAKEGHYPMANSHLVLAMEEAVKAIFLYVKYIQNDVDIDVKKMFYNHQQKHEFARDSYDVFYKKSLEILGQVNEAFKESFSEEVLSKMDVTEAEIIKGTMEVFETRYSRIAKLNLEVSLPNIYNWFNEADQRKKNGFYVDFQYAQWQTPDTITHEDYRFSEFVSWTLILVSRQFKMMDELKKRSLN